MNSSGKSVAIAALCCLLSQMCGCVSSSLVDIWHDPFFKAPPLGKMLVIAVRKDATKRRIWEDAFAGELVKHGMAATSSYSLFPDAPPDTNQLIATVQANGFDGILAILMLPTETNSHHVQGYTTTTTTERDEGYTTTTTTKRDGGYTTTERDERYTSYFGPYWKRYRTYYREIEHPGYIDSQTVDVRAIDVSTTGAGGRLIWSATSRTSDPAAVTDVQRGIVSLVLTELGQRRIINSGK
ncbi:MAG: hypothetical protein JW913_19940 [Chitinispirillaceae bacterium]|nr:hypothetical protein [Chitinispirillaceae bacterium]